MSEPQPEKSEKEKELEAAIKRMNEALDSANGNCARRIRSRTTAMRRALLDLAGEAE